jgi:hypothetical protein
MKINVVHPIRREQYYEWPEGRICPLNSGILLDLSQPSSPMMYVGFLHGCAPDTLSYVYPFWLPRTQELTPEDIGRCMDAILPLCERFAENPKDLELKDEIERAVDAFFMPERFLPDAEENLAAVPLQ